MGTQLPGYVIKYSATSVVLAYRYIGPLVAANRSSITNLGPNTLGPYAPLSEIIPIGEAVSIDVDLGFPASHAGVRRECLLGTFHRFRLEAEVPGPIPDVAVTVAGLGVFEIKLCVGVGGVFHVVRCVVVDDTTAKDFAAACCGDGGRNAGEEQQRKSCGMNKKGEKG